MRSHDLPPDAVLWVDNCGTLAEVETAEAMEGTRNAVVLRPKGSVIPPGDEATRDLVWLNRAVALLTHSPTMHNEAEIWDHVEELAQRRRAERLTQG